MYIPAVVINLDALYITDRMLDNLDFTDWTTGYRLGILALLIFRCCSGSGGLPETTYNLFFLNLKIIY